MAIGDGLTALLALIAFLLLSRRSRRALAAVLFMNVIGLLDILTSEAWLGALEVRGTIARDSFLHGPSVGAALFTAVHLFIFYVLARQATASERGLLPPPSPG